MRIRIRLFTLIFLLFGFSFFSNITFAADEPAKAEQQETFNPGKFIIDHVTDKYEWHIAGPHEGGISVPLPVILYSKGKGLDIFLSSKFEEKEGYHGYKLNGEGHIEAEGGASFYDFSITKAVAGIFLASILTVLIFISVARSYARREGQAPKGFQSLIEPLIIFVRDDIAKQSIGEKHYKRFSPLLLTLFFFIWISNFIGLIPSMPGVMGNISVAFTLSAIVLVITLFIGNKHYWQHILWMPGVPAWVKICLLTPIEIIGVFQRPFVLMIRVFANIAAGHIVILSFVCLIFVFSEKGDAGGWGFAPISMAFALFMNAMELLVAFLQAFVFTLLTAMYIGSCLEEPHHAENH
ncbi:MAG: F0F1 ATP synthase subunit A [Bacteroidetes bacterium]|nr:F0F1 ATP synthase subunit A [Bacteroidota bacterium]